LESTFRRLPHLVAFFGDRVGMQRLNSELIFSR
jgi:hypothetical protein